MTSLADTRTELAAAITAALTDDEHRVATYPARPGNLTRTGALITVGHMYRLGDDLGRVGCELEIQVGLGPGIDKAYATMDDLLELVDDALPINWQLAAWTMLDDQDDQPVLYAITTLEGWAVAAGTEITWDEATVTWDDAAYEWNGATV